MKKSILPPDKSSSRIKFLADECIGLPTISLLRESGYAVVTVLEEAINNTLRVLLNELKPDNFNKTLIVVDADKYRLRKE